MGTYLEAALTKWWPSPAMDEPLTSAAEAIGVGAPLLPVLLPEILKLLCESVRLHQLPEAQLKALRETIWKTRCLPADAARAAELFMAAVDSVICSLVDRRVDVLLAPPVLSAFFGMLSSAL